MFAQPAALSARRAGSLMCCAVWSVMTVLLAWRVDLLLGGCECARP
jgi:hypothetical protein